MIFVFDKIRSSCKYVMNNSQYVSINYDKIDEFIKVIDCSKLKNWLLYNSYGLLDLNVETVINFLLVFQSIDYSFWGDPKWTIETEEGFKDGSDALLYAMLEYVKKTNNTDFSNISFEEFKKILKGNVAIPLLNERYKTVVEVSRIVNKKMDGNFYQYIKDITTDVDLFNIIVNNFPSFIDERTYDGTRIYIYKLAQLLTSDILHIREILENIKVDYSNLIGCADYKIPQTLRALGITEYNEELSNVIDTKQAVNISSKYEVEIRASQIVVLDYIKSKLKNVNSIDVNDFFFIYSKKVKDIRKPYHLCRNTNY